MYLYSGKRDGNAVARAYIIAIIIIITTTTNHHAEWPFLAAAEHT